MTATPPRLSKCSDRLGVGQLSACLSARQQGPEAKLLRGFPRVVTHMVQTKPETELISRHQTTNSNTTSYKVGH